MYILSDINSYFKLGNNKNYSFSILYLPYINKIFKNNIIDIHKTDIKNNY